MSDDERQMSDAALELRWSALSDLGRHRKDNQDSGYVGEHLIVVADGVGGAAYGDVASSTAVYLLRRLDSADATPDMLDALARAIGRTHAKLAEMVESDPELDGTSTTITAALFDGHRLGVAHVGDSRAYLLRGGELSQLTSDHTFVQGLVDEGRITEEESRTHPHRNLILRAVDGVHEAEPDLFHVEVRAGDRLLFCSDGCSGVLPNERIAAVLGDGPVDLAAVELVRAALDAGTTDNVTVLVADVVDAAALEETRTPMLVGAAAAQPRKASAALRGFLRGHRPGEPVDTGELEPVQADDTDPEQLRYAPRAPRRFVWLRRLLAVAAVLLVVAALLRWAYGWSQDQFYVAADGPYVAVFRGVDADVPGIDLSSVEEVSEVTLDALPEFRADQVRGGMDADSLEDARAIVERLTGLARVCPDPEAAAGSGTATPGATRTPTAGATRRPASPAGRPAGSPAGSPAGTPTSSPGPTGSPSPTTEPLAPPDCIEPSVLAGTATTSPSPEATP
jgi:protein phosphatase